MEDSLYGFRFKSQTSLLVSDQHDIAEIDIEPMQWQEPQQHDVRNLQPPHSYCDEATQTPNWEDQDQRVKSPSAQAFHTRQEDGRQGEPTNSKGTVEFPIHDDSAQWRRQLIWYEAGHLGYCPSSSTPQLNRVHQEMSDESMQMFPQTEPLYTGDLSYDDVNDATAYQYIRGESGSDASSITMEDACADDEGMAWEMAVDAEDNNPSDAGDGDGLEFEDEVLPDEPAVDVVEEGIRQRLCWATSEAQGLWE
ncbi:hypothetical protein TgHK011_009984 [Trichoderma gracile]|nr:hypothetical protein TgHK011_009984 [Trichoderma gracile]